MPIDGDLRKVWARGSNDPEFWCREVVGDTAIYDKQVEVLWSVKDKPFTTVKAAHGVGKTFIASRATGWFLTSFPESIVVTTAPTGRQVRNLLWSEINRMCAKAKYPLSKEPPLTTTWQIAPGWFAIGFSTTDPNKFQGFHPGSGRILVIADEAAGVDELVFKEGIDPLLTSELARLLMIGNPTEATGRFHDSFHGAARHLYNGISISAFDTPNLKAGRIIYPFLVTPQWVEHRRLIWGESSTAYQSRVEAKFPSVGSNTLIPASWVDRSFEVEEVEVRKNIKHIRVATIGVDPARFGDDVAGIAVRINDTLVRIIGFYHLDAVELADEIQRVADEFKIGTPSGTSDFDNFIVVDEVGVGGPCLDIMRHRGYKVIGFKAGANAFQKDRYADRRAEAWWNIRERFRTDRIYIPRHDDTTGFGYHSEEMCDKLRAQFSGIQYTFDADSRYVLESKKDMKKRLAGADAAERGEARGKSPDEAEGGIHAFAFDSLAETIVVDDDKPGPKIEVVKVMPGTVAELFAAIKRETADEAEMRLYYGG